MCQNLRYSSHLQFFRRSYFWIIFFSIRTFFNVFTLNLQIFIRYNIFMHIYCLMVSIFKLSHSFLNILISKLSKKGLFFCRSQRLKRAFPIKICPLSVVVVSRTTEPISTMQTLHKAYFGELDYKFFQMKCTVLF